MTPAGTALLSRIVAAYDAGRPLAQAGVDGRVLAGLGDLVELVPSQRRSRVAGELLIPTRAGREALIIAGHTGRKVDERVDLGAALAIIARTRITNAGRCPGPTSNRMRVAGMVDLVVELFGVTEAEVVERVDDYLAALN